LGSKQQRMNARIHHVNVTVPKDKADAAKHFYSVVMQLKEVSKPEESRGRGGAWYQLGEVQLHLSIQDNQVDDGTSKRHVSCCRCRENS
jgi:catechol 2,3-dioxygenase-like lactoylglutathione lyase family enzyme